jgi:hypothetical protein
VFLDALAEAAERWALEVHGDRGDLGALWTRRQPCGL